MYNDRGGVHGRYSFVEILGTTGGESAVPRLPPSRSNGGGRDGSTITMPRLGGKSANDDDYTTFYNNNNNKGDDDDDGRMTLSPTRL